jgi:hypothetical protein
MRHTRVAGFAERTAHGSPIGRREGPWVRLVVTVLIWACLAGPIAHAQQSRPTEYQVEATYLYNFGKFVNWSATNMAAKDDSFAICVLGQDPFGAALDAVLAQQSIGGKSVVARRITKPQEALNCRILFISSSEDRQLKGVLAALDGAGILTVSDIPQFSQRGGMIEFTLEGNKVRFEVNLTTAENARLILSSELLKVAVTVRRNSQSGD